MRYASDTQRCVQSTAFLALSQASRRPSPPLDLWPVPDERLPELRDRFGEGVVASSPVVHDLGALYSESLCDFCGADELIDIQLSAHDL